MERPMEKEAPPEESRADEEREEDWRPDPNVKAPAFVRIPESSYPFEWPWQRWWRARKEAKPK